MDYIEFVLTKDKKPVNMRYYGLDRIEYESKKKKWKNACILTHEKVYKRVMFIVDKIRYRFRLHRIVYYVHNQDWNIYDNSMSNFIDHNEHTTGIMLDNSIENLRIVTNQQNSFNRNAKGYYWTKSSQKWRALIKFNKKSIHLGYFDIEADARQAYLNAKSRLHVIVSPTAQEST